MSPSFPPPGFRNLVAESRRALLGAIGRIEDAVLFRGPGNPGDELIAAGTRRLLGAGGCVERPLSELPRSRGRTALLPGGGSWCSPYHEILPRALAVAERRFDRVVVLPSSFDPDVEEIARALSRTGARVFARERASLARIEGLCRASLAVDCAFFFDFEPYRRSGSGTLNAFRTDREAAGTSPPPRGNDDISARCRSLDEWLWTIAGFEAVRTDRAHVMIAAAMLGKTVEYRSSSYHKVPAIAEYALGEFPVRPVPVPTSGPPAAPDAPAASPAPSLRLRRAASNAAAALPRPPTPSGGRPRATVLILTRNRPAAAIQALRSVAESFRQPWRALLIDNGSRPDATVELRRAVDDPRVDVFREAENLGCAGGRRSGIGRIETEFVVFLDDDAEMLPGAPDRLIEALDRDPEALAVGANVVSPDGSVQGCGGDWSISDGVLFESHGGAGRRFDDPAIGSSGPTRWITGAAGAYRRSAFEKFPIDPEMRSYYEDLEWCYRIDRASPGRLRRCVEALVVHHNRPKVREATADLLHSMPYVETIARFYARHDLVLDGLFGFVHALVSASGRRNGPAARILLELVNARGADWVVLNLVGGGLAPLTAGIFEDDLDGARRELAEIKRSRWWKAATKYWQIRRRLKI